MEQEGTRGVREYLAILRRYALQIIAVTAMVAAVAIAVANGLPPLYRATATVLVREQEIAPEVVRTTIQSYADERIQVISQQVMTRAVLAKLIDKHGLYERYRERESEAALADRMRKDIKLVTVDANMSDRSSGRRVNATIAFQVSYDAPSPEQAQEVVSELASLYLEQNEKARQQSAAQTTAFLAQEAERLIKQVRGIEADLADFKHRNRGTVPTPEWSASQVQLAQRIDAELSRVQGEIRTVQDRKLTLDAKLALVKRTLPPAGSEQVLTPAQRLRVVQSRLAAASAVYSTDHPDIRRMQREIAGLRSQIGPSDAQADSTAKLHDLETELAALKERYSDDHPDVQKLKRSIAALQRSGSGGSAAAKSVPKATDAAAEEETDNPAYLTLVAEIESTKRELARLGELADDLRSKQRAMDERLELAPDIEREYRELARDYDNAQNRYRDVKDKQLKAEVALQLEKEGKSERFALGEPAVLPERPHSPNRMRILLIGLVASLGSGLGLAWLRDLLDSSVFVTLSQNPDLLLGQSCGRPPGVLGILSSTGGHRRRSHA